MELCDFLPEEKDAVYLIEVPILLFMRLVKAIVFRHEILDLPGAFELLSWEDPTRVEMDPWTSFAVQNLSGKRKTEYMITSDVRISWIAREWYLYCSFLVFCMGNSAESEITLSGTGKFSHLDAVESMLLGLSLTKNNNFGADAERWALNPLFTGLFEGHVPRN